jgi:ABC transport system ATP-binding/permease protein
VKVAKPEAAAAPVVTAPTLPIGKVKLTYKDQRDYDLLPARIEELQAAIARDEAALHDPALYTRDPAKFAALTEAIGDARAEKDAAEERWLELAELVEG